MVDFLKRCFSSLKGSLHYSTLSLWLNITQYSLVFFGLITKLTANGFLLPYQGFTFAKLWLRFSAGVVVGTLGLVVGTALSLILLPFMVAATLFDLVHNLIRGALDGYSFIDQVTPLDWNVFSFDSDDNPTRHPFTLFSRFYRWVMGPQAGHSVTQPTAVLLLNCIEQHLLSNEEPLKHFLEDNPLFRGLAEQLIKDKERDRNAFIKLQQVNPVKDNKLTAHELVKARALQTPEIKLLVEQYNRLLLDLDAADDQLIQMEFDQDAMIILFVKQYQSSSNQWEAVPLATLKSCKENAEHWFKSNAIQPLTNDNVLEPKKYNDRPTRYVWHRYDVSQGDGSQLLNQLSDKIRQVTAKLEQNVTPEPTNPLSATIY
jgi:hypothetical protein